MPRKESKQPADRKTAVERVLKQANKIASDAKAANQAWLRLVRELEFMVEPEAKMPRFNRLLHAVWIAATGEQT